MGTNNTPAELTGTDRKVSQLLGDAYFKREEYHKALEHYIASGDQVKILACGDYELRRGVLEHGIQAYEALNRMIPMELLIACGDAGTERLSPRALDAYKMAGAKDKLIAFGDACQVGILKGTLSRDLENDHYAVRALDAYIASGNVKIIGVFARKCLKLAAVTLSFRAFSVIGDKEGLIETGDVAMRDGRFDLAAQIFKAAGSWQKLIELGDKRLDTLRDYQSMSAEAIYRIAAELYEQQTPSQA